MAADISPVHKRLFNGENRPPKCAESSAHTVQQPKANNKYKTPIIAFRIAKRGRKREA
jgi:hypothetical protein